jgi:MFS family permease
MSRTAGRPAVDQSAVDQSAVDRVALQRRTLRVLAAGQVIGAAALASAVTVGAFVVQGMLGQQTPWSGGATATVTLGTAFMSQALSRRMRRRGRRPGLQGGYGLAVIGGLVAALGAERGTLAVFLVGLFLYGSGQAANLLARYAATDLAAPEERSRAMSRIVFASTFGAVFGPLLIGPAEHAGEVWFGLGKYTGPWLFSSMFFAAAFCTTVLFLRPDPLVVAGGLVADDSAPAGPRPRPFDALRTIRSAPGAPLALAAMAVSQAVMVGVMAMTPVHMKLHGHESLSQYVVSTHIAGMYAFSPLVGRFSDRRGRLPAVLLGSVLLVAATVLAALSGDVELALFPALWLLGLGWNFGLIGGSSLLTDRVPAEERVAVQGTADLLMSVCGGLAGFSSGFVRRAVGYHALAGLATVLAGGLLAAAYLAHRSVDGEAQRGPTGSSLARKGRPPVARSGCSPRAGRAPAAPLPGDRG